jgi:cell division protein FtsW
MRRRDEADRPVRTDGGGGLFMLIGLQAAINIAVNLNLIPTKGMTLPFISYGGSSMLAMGLTLGLALALTRKRPRRLRAAGGRIRRPRAARDLG